MKRVGILAVTIGLAALFAFPMAARAQFLFVDCSGTNPLAYPTINSALPNAGPGAFIAVTGTCNESVFLYGSNNLMLGAFFGQTATLNGNLSINNSQLVYVYGLNITNAFGDGIDVNSSRSVVLDTCTSNGNAGVISCDSTSTMVSDLAISARTSASGVSCTTAHSLGNRLISVPAPAAPDSTPWKTMHSMYQQRSSAQK
jgi:hypothetical protein